MPAATNPLDKLVDRAGTLYSLPTVAMEVVRLSSQDNADTRTLKETIEGDPALTAKILRVVNSSMFGLSGEVANLTQALALLGVRPLRLLVLGFSLPDRLFADLASEELQDYWTTALTRAVAARAIATDWFADTGPSADTGSSRVNGDDAFVAGLLRDLGVLVLMQEIGEPYLKFLRSTRSSPDDLPAAERLTLEKQSLGFDHVELTASLMQKWKLPATLASAVLASQAAPQDQCEPLAEVVALADLVTQLVANRRLQALAELLDRGATSCELTKPMVNDLVEPLEQQVTNLAEALRAPIVERPDYQQTLVDAHAQMTMIVADEFTGDATAVADSHNRELSDDELSESLLAESHELRLAMRGFLRGATSPTAVRRSERTEAGHAPGAKAATPDPNPAAEQRLQVAVDKLAQQCRQERTDLSVALLAIGGMQLDPHDRPTSRRFEEAFTLAEDSLTTGRAARLTLSDTLVAVVMPGVDRRSANAFCQRLSQALQQNQTEDHPVATLHAGVASIVAVPNRFEPQRLIEGATRCLLASQTAAASSVKSIEVY